jgi:hypothetical protein
MRYEFTVTGLTPLLLHADNLLWSDTLKEWRDSPENKAISTRGDDRSPAWTWLGCIPPPFGEYVSIPADYLTSCLKQAGARVPTGKGTKTYKEGAVSMIWFCEDEFPILIDDKPLSFTAIKNRLSEELDFTKHLKSVREMGFDLDARRAKIGQSKHVRVRPKFIEWGFKGSLEVQDDSALPERALASIFDQAGRVGIGDWRPGAKTPGRFGMFAPTVKRAK